MVEVRFERFDAIDAYAQVPTAFLVTSELQPLPDDSAPSGFSLHEQIVANPFTKDYDGIADNRPTDWAKHFDTAAWQLFSAFDGNTRVGGAITFVTANAQNRDASVAELWDLRVSPDRRRSGVASVLFQAVESWAIRSRCAVLSVETQHINVAACRLYERQGCTLHAVRAGAYPDFPGEVRLIWRKTIPEITAGTPAL